MSTNEAPMAKSDTKPPVQVKATRDGLLFLLEDQCEWTTLLDTLHELLLGENEGLFDGPEVKVSVDFGDRALTSVETRQLLEIFLQRENFSLAEWGAQTNARRSLLQNRKRAIGHQHIFKGTVRAGQRLVFEGDVVIVGDVNPGGEVVAGGDIYVFGKLAGIAHAGAWGDIHCVIAAAEFTPMQLRIASVISRAPEETKKGLHTFMEFAYLRGDGMAVDRLQYLASTRALRQSVATVEEDSR